MKMMKLTIDGYGNITNNKYFRLYRNIIIKRIITPPDSGTYCELHHILPKCLGGNNEKNNVVFLSSREHYIVHLLLTKFVTDCDKYKMICAFSYMNFKSKTTMNRYQNSKLYEYHKIQKSIITSEFMKKLWNDPDYKQKMIENAKLSWYNGLRDKQIEYMKNNSNFKIKEIHNKTILNREKNKNNIFTTDNPMKNKQKVSIIVSKRSGNNHYLMKKYVYEYSENFGKTWNKLEKNNMTVKQLCDSKNWSIATFNSILSGKIPKRGNMANINIRKIINENN